MKIIRIVNAFLFLAFLITASIGLLCSNAALCVIGGLGLFLTVAVGIFTIELGSGPMENGFVGY